MIKPKWKYVNTELGVGIECTSCHRKLGAKTVIFGDKDINTCPFCEKEMVPIKQSLLDRLKEEADWE